MAPIPLLSAGEDGPRLGKDGTMRRDRGVVACSRSPGMLHRFRPSILSLSLSFHFVSFRRESKDCIVSRIDSRIYIYMKFVCWNYQRGWSVKYDLRKSKIARDAWRGRRGRVS